MRFHALSPEDRARITRTIKAAEARTAGEIYVVVARTADAFRLLPPLWAAVCALLVPWPMVLLTSWSTSTILILQALAFVLLGAALSYEPVRYLLVPPRFAAEATRRAAHRQFLAHGVHLTSARTGVLIFVAITQRRVEVVADDGIDKKVAQSVWDDLANTIASAAKTGQLADGLVRVVERAGGILAEHFPRRPDDRNELPDRVVEMG